MGYSRGANEFRIPMSVETYCYDPFLLLFPINKGAPTSPIHSNLACDKTPIMSIENQPLRFSCIPTPGRFYNQATERALILPLIYGKKSP